MSVRIMKPGMLTTVQDEGRWGYQNLGVSVAGPMDRVSHRLSNLLVGNRRWAATLEVTLIGPELEFERETVFVVTGAEFHLTLNDVEIPMNTPTRTRRGSVLRLKERRRGARAYVAVRGGFNVPLVLGSRSTHLASCTGGVDGRALVSGDRIPVGEVDPTIKIPNQVKQSTDMLPVKGAYLRVMMGPQEKEFSAESLETLRTARYEITPQSNRMGYRLAGSCLYYRTGGSVLSDGTPIGSVQVPPAGEPILLMADGQTSGGYPKVSTVITADLSLAGQLAPGDWIQFSVCDHATAVRALIAQERFLME